jgi:hypothetical protein
VEENTAASEEMSAQVEEVTAAAQSLSAMAEELQALISRFKLSDAQTEPVDDDAFEPEIYHTGSESEPESIADVIN